MKDFLEERASSAQELFMQRKTRGRGAHIEINEGMGEQPKKNGLVKASQEKDSVYRSILVERPFLCFCHCNASMNLFRAPRR